MIRRASQAAEQAGFSNVEFRLGDAEEMPLPDESVDVVISNCVINLTLDKGRVFREAYRVLRPGGRLMISDIVTDKPLPEPVRSDADEWACCVGGAIPEEEYTRLITEAGVERVLCIHGLDFRQVGDVRAYSASVSARKPSRRLSACGAIGTAMKNLNRKEINMPTEQEIREALRPVVDPEIGISVVDLGMIREVVVEGDAVEVKMVLTAPFCPLAGMITNQVRQAAAAVPGVKEAKVTLLDEPWNPAWMAR